MKKVHIFIVISILFWPLWSRINLVATDWNFWFSEGLKDGFFLPYLWRNTLGAEGLGQRVFSTIWLWPATFPFSLGAKLDFSFAFLTRILAIIPITVLVIYSIHSLLTFLKVKEYARTAAVFLYILNTYFLLLIDGGQLFIAYSYALFPLVVRFFLQALENKKITSDIKFVLSFLLLTIFDIRISFLFFVFALFRSFYALGIQATKRKDVFKNLLRLFLLTSFSFVGVHAFWILPGVKYLLFNSTFETFADNNLADFSLVSIKHSFLLQQPHWYKNIFGVISSANKFFLLLPMLAFSTVFVRKRKKEIGFFLFLAIFAIFFAKGTNPPWGDIYEVFYRKVPGFSFFRDPSKFFVLISLSYSLLIAFLFDFGLKNKKLGKFLSYVFVFYLIVLVWPVYLGKMTGLFSKPAFEREYFRTVGIINSEEKFSRTLWVPERKPLSFSSNTHPSVSAFDLASYRPFATGTVGNYEAQNYLREHPFMDQILTVTGVRYLVYVYPDTKRQNVKQDNIDYYYTFLSQLEEKDWVKSRLLAPPVAVLETNSHSDHFFSAKNRWVVIGSDRIYWDLSDLENFSLHDNALIFAEDGFSSVDFDHSDQQKIILYKKGLTDLAFNLTAEKKDTIFPANYLEREPRDNISGWWKRDSADFVWWRDFLQSKYGLDNADFAYGGGWAIAEGEKTLNLSDPEFSKGKVLLVRLMLSSVGGKVEFYQNTRKIGEADTLLKSSAKTQIQLTGKTPEEDQTYTYDSADFAWIEIGELFSNAPLTIKTKGQINVINALYSVEKLKWQESKDSADDLMEANKVLIWEDLTDENLNTFFDKEPYSPKLEYQRLDPTRYRVKIADLDEPTTLVFSEKYDPLWEIKCVDTQEECSLANKKPVALYSLFNGFEITRDGEYEVYFTPQKYVLPGLVVSFLTLSILFAILLKYRRR